MSPISRNILSRKIINYLIKQLDSGTSVILIKSKLDLLPHLSEPLRVLLAKDNVTSTSKRILRYMRNQKLVAIENLHDGKFRVRLTGSGVERAHKIVLDELSIPRPSRWDHRWRVVFFDVPESKRPARNRLVLKLKRLGFYQLQKSIWVHPYPCSIEIEYLKRIYNLAPHVNLAEISRIDAHRKLLYHFRHLLPRPRLS